MISRVAGLALAALILAGCASPGVAPPKDAEGRYLVNLTSDLKFDPPEIRIPLGATVVWNNTGTVGHDVNAYPPDNGDYPDWSSSDPAPKGIGHLVAHGESVHFTFEKKGTWTIWCHTHHEERMKQVVHVG